MNANKAHYEMKRGDEAIVKGVQKSYSKMNANQVTCLGKY